MDESRTQQTLEQENESLREQLRYYQEYDPLTRLYNKNTFYRKAAECFSARPGGDWDIVCLDVERFKLVNDLYGPGVGDDLLCYIARELREAFQPGGVVARLANDVFALCLPRSRRGEAERRILEIFRAYPLDMPVVPAVGFCPVADPAQRVSSMCDWAMLAMKSVKGDYVRHIAVYDGSQRSLLLEEQELLNSVGPALENHEFELYMQPKCNMRSGKIVGAEALVRWRHPKKGVLPPGAFIPAFERNGFIKRLDAYVWEEAARWLRRWIDAGRRPLPVSVNISRVDIYGMDVCRVLRGLLERYGLDPSLLELEITESAYANRSEEIVGTMEELMGHGFTVLMDDFGSGYSSLNMLNDISVDVLKIDMGFLARDDQKSKDILESVVHMGKWLDLPIIAEGVETRRQVDFLLDIGCVYAQGYYFYKPMPLSEYEALLLEPDRVDDADGGKLRVQDGMLLDFRDLLHKDMLSDRLLEHLMGAIALYQFDGVRLQLLRGTEEYYRLSGLPAPARDLLSFVLEEDRSLLLDGLRQAKMGGEDAAVTVHVRRRREDGVRWLQLRLFYLAEKAEGDIFYSSLSDVTEQMEAMERLRISEEQFCLAMEATNSVVFELDIGTREARYSEYAQRAFGLEASVADAPESFLRQGTVCPESEADFRGVYEAIYRGEPRASRIVHARLGDGSRAWNRVTLTAVKDRSGRPVKAVGLVETLSLEETPPPEVAGELARQARVAAAAPPTLP